MTYSFSLDKKSFSSSPQLFSALQKIIDQYGTVTTEKGYSLLIQNLIAHARTEKTGKDINPLFQKEIKSLTLHSPLIELTPWGGVSIKKIDTTKDFVQKLLLVNQFGILGFEIHKKKLEKLHILEGECLFISSQHKNKNWEKGRVKIAFGKKSDKVTLEPGDEHGIIALTNCVIEETSTNHLDDLVFIFQARHPNSY